MIYQPTPGCRTSSAAAAFNNEVSMPIVLFLICKQFQVVSSIMPNTKPRRLWPELLLTVTTVARLQSFRPPEFNLSANSVHSSKVYLAEMKTDRVDDHFATPFSLKKAKL